MRRWLRWLIGILVVLLLIIILVPLAVVGVLNTGAGRHFAVKEINHFTNGKVVVSGLGGHFPSDIKIASLTLADSKGVWLTAHDLELRWHPMQLLSRRVHITSLTAASMDIVRSPVSKTPKKKTSAPLNLHHFTLTLDKFAIQRLGIGAAIAGKPLILTANGSGQVKSPTQGSGRLDAVAQDGGTYRLTAALDKKKMNVHLLVSEPPDGLLGHYAGPQVHAPLHLAVDLAGPRNDAAVKFSAALGAARLDGTGTLGLEPKSPHADLILTVPALAPIGQYAHKDIGGAAKLHLVASRKGKVTDLALSGDLKLTQAPAMAAKLVGSNGHLDLRMQLVNDIVAIRHLTISGAEFSAAASGKVSKTGIDLDTKLHLDQVADVSPKISGNLTDENVITGPLKDFAVQAKVSGTIKAVQEKNIPSAPFTLTLDAQHLPYAPQGTVQASGELENAPLDLNASFARDKAGATTVHVANASWRSIDVKADLALAKGAVLPTGTAKIDIPHLSDLAAFSPVPIAGSVRGNFSHENTQNFALDLTARSLEVSPKLGAINGHVTASGPINRLAVKVDASIAKLHGAPFTLATAAVVDGDSRSGSLTRLTADWKTLRLRLLQPAGIETKPAVAVHHLALGVNGGTIRLDGRLSPSLDLTLAVDQLPADLAEVASPSLKVRGTIGAHARITGSRSAPSGRITVKAAGIKLLTGEGRAIPPADLAATIDLAGKKADLTARLTAGPDARLNADGTVPFTETGAIDLKLGGMLNLAILDPVVSAKGTLIRGVITPNFTVTGTPKSPNANGTLAMTGGSVQNIASGLSLQDISAQVNAANRLVTLQNFQATAGKGTISGHGTINLAQPSIPIRIAIHAKDATPISSDLVTETLDGALNLTGAFKGAMKLAGKIDIAKANINIPHALPPSVAKLKIYRPGEKQPAPAAAAAAVPDVALDLLVVAHNQIFIRGDGLFAEVGGQLKLGGTLADPIPSGGFDLIRGDFSLGGKSLQFTKGVVSFNGGGFLPSIDFEATTTTSTGTATLVIGGTAAKPTITLTSSPPLPSDEVLSQLLFGESTQNLSPFQAASLASALATLSGVGGNTLSDPLGGVRSALGLDQLSIGGGENGGAPSVQAGRYVAPGVYVGAQQSTTGNGSQATVQINLLKGLKLQTQTGTSSTGTGDASSVGLTYQFNY